jgi:polyphenol oxidase
MTDLPVFNAHTLRLAGIGHGFFGRRGGVSEGLYASLNAAPASKDAREALIENRRRIASVLGGYPLLSLAQYHSAVTVTVAKPWTMEQSPKADALVSKTAGIILGLVTADCAPVLLADPAARVIGAAHAGWKGALGGVCESAVAAMEALGAQRGRIVAAIGPCIGQSSYEVGPEFRAEFPDAAAEFFIASGRAGFFRFDLEGYVAGRLTCAGVASVEKLGTCTFAHPDDFFSFRRATLAGETDYGREMSAIVLMP